MQHSAAGATTGRVLRATLLALSALAAAAPAADLPVVHVRVLRSQDAAPYRAVLRGFQEQLEADGFRAAYDVHDVVDGRRLPDAFLEADPRGGPDLVLPIDPVASGLAVRHVMDVPVVAALLVGPEEFDASPNATGVRLDYSVEEQLRWIRRLLPDREAVGVLFGPTEQDEAIERANGVAHDLALELVSHRIARPNDLPSALHTIARRADVVWGISDHTVFTPQTARQLIVYSFQNRIALSGLSTSWVKAGALYSLDRDYVDVGRQVAEIAKRVLEGMSPADIPTVTPRKVIYSVNLKTARHMNIEISADTIREAAHVFE